MTTREKAHRLLDELPESEIEPVLDFIVARGANGIETEAPQPGDIIDAWGNLSAMRRASSAQRPHQLDEEELAEFGETIAEAWKYESPR